MPLPDFSFSIGEERIAVEIKRLKSEETQSSFMQIYYLVERGLQFFPFFKIIQCDCDGEYVLGDSPSPWVLKDICPIFKESGICKNPDRPLEKHDEKINSFRYLKVSKITFILERSNSPNLIVKLRLPPKISKLPIGEDCNDIIKNYGGEEHLKDILEEIRIKFENFERENRGLKIKKIAIFVPHDLSDFTHLCLEKTGKNLKETKTWENLKEILAKNIDVLNYGFKEA